MDEWGHHAPAKVAMVQSRFSRLIEGMRSRDDQVIFLAWFNSLSTKAAGAVLRYAAR